MENKEINFDVITSQYRKKGAALKAYINLNKLISNNSEEKLRSLLRNHLNSQIETDEEINKRDDIDFLIDYYSIIEIALIADYIPNPLPNKLSQEVGGLLTNKYLYKYFSEHYPLLLPQVLLKQIENNDTKIYTNKIPSILSYSLFERFLMLRQYIKEDQDIDQFLWFLDDGWTGNYSIADFWAVLENQNLIQYKLGRTNRHPLNSALWGFIKYIQFLSDYANLIRDAQDNTLLQSALWHHQSHWFKNMKTKLGSIITIGITNIKNSINNVNAADVINNKNSFLNSHEDMQEWQNDSFRFEDVENDIKYLLNEQLGKPLIEYYKSI